ncbi:hypothetical protein NE237_020828 [Protea cynaroides]|uniref:peptidylprolyl isomerase n=1 Tax=Protea cynaroides TaxID=273540 RepID=A0A9Q0K4A5_9MAGN|nr:hypothetical protein NE237_020828 [Protea cynaroides]
MYPFLHILLPLPPPYQPISSPGRKFSMRVASKQAYICRDCRFSYSNRILFEKSPDNSCTELQCMARSALKGLEGENGAVSRNAFERREVLFSTVGVVAAATWHALKDGVAVASEFADMPALRGKDYGKTKMRYPDYAETESGLQYKDLRVGSGPMPMMGETVVVDWDGYTIGYYGRIFEARNKTKGGSFEGDDKDFFKFTLGSQQVIPAFEEAVSGMNTGGIRRIIVPPELGYPESDFNKRGPRPTTFSPRASPLTPKS